MAARLFLLPFPTAFSSNGLAVPGARLKFYATGTSTPLPAYTSSALTTEHPWPVVSNGAGRFPGVYLNDAITYRLVIEDEDGNELDEVDPYLPGTLIGTAGAPGGNVMSIGLFDEASGIEIDEGTDLVQTSGFNAVGTGAGLYIADALVDADYVEDNPLTSFMDANGRGFRLSLEQDVTPFHFGAVGNESLTTGVTDDSAALIAFLGFCATRRVPRACIVGEFGVSSTVYYDANYFDGGNSGDRFYTTNFYCNFRMRALADMDSVMHLEKWAGIRMTGHLHFLGGLDGPLGGEPFTARKAFTGLFLAYCGNSLIDLVQATNLKYAGVQTEKPPSNTNMLQIRHIYAKRVGSCPNGSGNLGLQATVSARADQGSSNDFGQYSELTVDVLPPTYFDNQDTIQRTINVYRSGDPVLYTVVGINRADSKIHVRPWFPSGVSSGTIDYIFGAAMVSRGNDSNLHHIGTIHAQNCGGGLDANCLYGGEVGIIHSEGRSVALRVGNMNPASTIVGLHVGRLYAEGVRASLMLQSVSAGGIVIDSYQPNDWSYVKTGGNVRAASTFALTDTSGLAGVQIGSAQSGQWTPRMRRAGTSVTLNFNEPETSGTAWYGDTLNFTLTAINDDLRRLFFNDGGTILVRGSGSSDAPATSVTFTATSGYTVNGGATAVFNSLTKATEFSVRLASGATDWKVVAL